MIVLKVFAAFVIEAGLIIAIIHYDWHDKHPIITLLVSNLVTLYVTYKTANILKQFKQAIFDSNMEESLRQQNERLTSENGELRDLLDTNNQIKAHFNSIEFVSKIELMENSKIGYLVKEEKLEAITSEKLKKQIPEATFLEEVGQMLRDQLGFEQKEQSVLFINKIYRKSVIGINLKDIKYSIDEQNGVIYLYGVELQVLHDASGDLPRDKNDISHCLIINTKTKGAVSVKNNKRYKAFIKAYKEYYEEQARDAHNRQDDNLCRKFTQALQNFLTQRYNNLNFVSSDSEEYKQYDWHTLDGGNVADVNVMRVLIDMNRGMKLIEQSYKGVSEGHEPLPCVNIR